MIHQIKDKMASDIYIKMKDRRKKEVTIIMIEIVIIIRLVIEESNPREIETNIIKIIRVSRDKVHLQT